MLEVAGDIALKLAALYMINVVLELAIKFYEDWRPW